MEQNMTVAQELLKFLSQNGINTIFGVVGDAVFPFFEALGQQEEVNFYGASHEAGAAFMASYYAKITGQVGVCVATSGPGIINLMNGLADAYFDKAPVLAITGQVQTNKIGTKAKQYINQQGLMQTVSKSSELVTSADSVLIVAAKALAKAVNERTVAHLSIPVDLFTQKISNPKLPVVSAQFSGRWGSGFADSLEEAVGLLQSSQRPLLVIGKGKQEWREIFVRLAETIGAGIIVAQQAKGVVPDKHPMVIGGIGEAYAPGLLAEADCILLIGTASFETKFLPGSAKIIQVVDDQEDLDYANETKGIIGEIRQIMKLLSERISHKQNQVWKDKIAREKQELENLIRQQKHNKTTPLHPAYLMTALNKVLPEDTVIVCDIGSFMHWFDTYFQAEKHTVLISSHWRSMSGGLPGALSACIAQRERKVVALVGDGGLLMSLGELAVAVKYKLPVTVVVANNQQYNLEKSKMEAKGLIPYGFDHTVPDFAMIAKAFGAEGRLVIEPNHLETVLKESVHTDKPFIINVILDSVSLPVLK